VIKDSELRGRVLQKYYDARGEAGMIQVPRLTDEIIDRDTAFRISTQLGEHGLIDWKPSQTLHVQTGLGKITADGVDVIEGTKQPPFAISVHDHRVQISNSSSIQVGTGNMQGVTISGERISIAIDRSNASQVEKEEAKSILQKILGSPLLSSILSGLGWTGD
jgi:hypothetical protein